MELRVGTSGFGYREWVGRFYPAGMRQREMLPYYAGRFRTVEINATFYRMPSLPVLESWNSQVPDGFVFTFKAPGKITHRKHLRDVDEETAAFAERLSVLGPRLGPVLFQLPPSLPCEPSLLRRFLEQTASLRVAVEFRHGSWFNDDVYALLRERGCALCLSDLDGAPPPPLVATAGFGYARLRRSDYTKRALRTWKERLMEQGWEEAFVFFRHEETAKGPVLAETFLKE